jgi:hypothetical protein
VWPKNLSLKLTALGLALLLWFHVATNREYDYPITLTLTVGEVPSGFSLIDPLPDHIRVILHGTGKELVRLLWNEGRAKLLLEPWVEGAYIVTANHIHVEVDADLHVRQIIEPSTFKVQVDTVVQRDVQVHFQGEYVTVAGKSLVRAPQLDPVIVTILGPRSKVNRIGSVGIESATIELDDNSTRVHAKVELEDAYGVTAMPGSVFVQFEVADSERRFIRDVPIQAPPGWVAEPSTITLNVSGAGVRLDELASGAYHASAGPPLTADSGAYVSVEATLPPFIEILSVTPDRVKLVRP